MAIKNLRTSRNFYVCGKRLGHQSSRPIEITLSANGIHEQSFVLDAAPIFNIGLIDPILLPGVTNSFCVSINYLDADGKRCGDASGEIRVGGGVVDDWGCRLGN